MGHELFQDLIRRVREFIHASDPVLSGSAGAQESTFESLALEVFAAQYDAVPPYRSLCQARGLTPGHVTEWRSIPAVPTTAFKEWDFTSLAPTERRAVFHSSGTTAASRSRHFHSAESLALYETSVCAGFAPALLPERTAGGRLPSPPPPCPQPLNRGEARWTPAPQVQGGPFRFVVLAPPSAAAPHSSLAHMFSTVATAFGNGPAAYLGDTDGAGNWRLDVGRTLPVLTGAVEANEPVVVLGTAFGFVHLLEHLEAAGTRLALPPGSRGLETGGYKGRSRELPKAELHRWIERRLGLPSERLVCEYGMSELGSQAYDGAVAAAADTAAEGGAPTAAGRRFRFAPWARAWVVSPEDGREVGEGGTGLLRVLDLANVRSVLAVQTEDLAVRRGEGFELLGRVPAAEARGCSLLAR